LQRFLLRACSGPFIAGKPQRFAPYIALYQRALEQLASRHCRRSACNRSRSLRDG